MSVLAATENAVMDRNAIASHRTPREAAVAMGPEAVDQTQEPELA